MSTNLSIFLEVFLSVVLFLVFRPSQYSQFFPRSSCPRGNSIVSFCFDPNVLYLGLRICSESLHFFFCLLGWTPGRFSVFSSRLFELRSWSLDCQLLFLSAIINFIENWGDPFCAIVIHHIQELWTGVVLTRCLTIFHSFDGISYFIFYYRWFIMTDRMHSYWVSVIFKGVLDVFSPSFCQLLLVHNNGSGVVQLTYSFSGIVKSCHLLDHHICSPALLFPYIGLRTNKYLLL